MSTYKKNPPEVIDVANSVIAAHESHRPLLNAKVRIDYLFAYPRYNEKDEPVGDAIKHHGVKALGLARKLSLKDRQKGNGDAEIVVDYEWWKDAPREQQAALLDHELHHLAVAQTKEGVVKTDDAGRPVIRIRPHDVQIGWFDVIAQRNSVHSQERIQATQILEAHGQYYFPGLLNVDRVEQAAQAVRARK